MALSAFGARIGLLKLPTIFISPSHKCNAKCKHCYELFNEKKIVSELSTNEVKHIIDEFHDLGGSKVYFCSGEFLLRDDALILISYARKYRMLVGITTNGLLVDENKINELSKAGLTDLIVSIDNPNSTIHDGLRGITGCFDKAIEAIKKARKKNISTHIWTYVSKSNLDGLDDIYKISRSLRVDETFVFFPLLSGRFYNDDNENLSVKQRESFRKKYNKYKDFNLEFPSEKSICVGGGFYHLNVMPTGDITFCPPVPYSYGNIKSNSLKETLIKMRKDHRKFCVAKNRGQCPINFKDYRENCNAKFIY